MRAFLCAAAILVAALAAHGESFTVKVHESATIEIPGTTAAYAIDPEIADISMPGAGRVTVTGRSAGTTQLIAVTLTGSKSFLITVAPPPVFAEPVRAASGIPTGRYEGRYSSSTAQLQNAFDVFVERADRRTHFHVLNVHYLEEAFGRESNAFPSVYYRVTTPNRELTLLDEWVDLSPVTIRSTHLRGFHLRQSNLEVHAGYAASTMYEDLFLPADRRWVGGAGYGFEAGGFRLIPSIYAFLSDPAGTAARRGVIGSLAAEHRRGDALFARGEIGVSRSIAASAELRYDGAADRVRARAWLKPDDFPTLGLNDTPGVHAEIDWSRRATSRLTIDSYAVFDRFDLRVIDQTIGVANVALGYGLSPSLRVLTGADASIVRTPGRSIRTIALPVGLTFDTPSFGAAASYRMIDVSDANRRGDSIRLSARGGRRGFRASAWAERQRHAPTLDLIFRETPGLEDALLRLGLSVRTPEDVARVIRDNAGLINLGFIEGLSVNLTPRRIMGGVDLGWIGTGAGHDQVRLHTVFSRDESVLRTRDLLFATLTYSRRLVAATDVYGSLSSWRSHASGIENADSSFEIGLRQRFEGLPSFLRPRGAVHGTVFLDLKMRGAPGDGTAPLAGIVVTLDRTHSTKTDNHGRYVFNNVVAGSHQVEAMLPEGRAAFFTTPSRAEIAGPARVDFGLIWTPARITGRLITDAGLGIGGAVFAVVDEHGGKFAATTDSDGAFSIAVPGGSYRIALAAESLPPGYNINGQVEQNVDVQPEQPQGVTFEVRALRSVSGKVASGPAEVAIEPLGRAVRTDGEGNFVFRSLPAGTFTITARSGGHLLRQSVTLPAEPAVIRDLTIGDAPATLPSATSLPSQRRAAEVVATPPPPVSSEEGLYHVQAGAFRIAANAAAARRSVERLGYKTRTMRVAGLEAIIVGPFGSRDAAEEEEQRLNRAGIDAVVLSERGLQVPSPLPGEAFLVQIGAFRNDDNVRDVMSRVSRLGHRPYTVGSAGLTIVRVGPFQSRRAAERAGERLREEGLETLVMAGAH